MKRTSQVVTKPSTLSSRELAECLSKDGQFLLPLVELLERGEKAIDEVIDVMGRATVEAVLRMSAEQLAGPKRQGERGEVAIPAYDAMQRDETVLPAMAEQVGIGKSEVSRETIEAGTRVLQDWAERDFSKVDVLMIYLDGIQFGNHHVLAAVGVDEDGKKYVLGVRSGAAENATVTTALLEDLVARGIRPDRRRRFVVDGAKALRSAIAQVFGAGNEVQRCRNHKLRNVVGHLPNAQHDQARATLRAAWKLEAKEGLRKLDQYASWLQRDWPDAAASVREGLDEIFTVNRLGLPASLRTCLTTTNIIDSTHSGIRQRTRRVTNWKNGEMARRWSAVAFVETEKNYRRITGYEHLWMLKAHLDRDDDNIAEMQKVG